VAVHDAAQIGLKDVEDFSVMSVDDVREMLILVRRKHPTDKLALIQIPDGCIEVQFREKECLHDSGVSGLHVRTDISVENPVEIIEDLVEDVTVIRGCVAVMGSIGTGEQEEENSGEDGGGCNGLPDRLEETTQPPGIGGPGCFLSVPDLCTNARGDMAGDRNARKVLSDDPFGHMLELKRRAARGANFQMVKQLFPQSFGQLPINGRSEEVGSFFTFHDDW
jgi:hypothetical protein